MTLKCPKGEGNEITFRRAISTWVKGMPFLTRVSYFLYSRSTRPFLLVMDTKATGSTRDAKTTISINNTSHYCESEHQTTSMWWLLLPLTLTPRRSTDIHCLCRPQYMDGTDSLVIFELIHRVRRTIIPSTSSTNTDCWLLSTLSPSPRYAYVIQIQVAQLQHNCTLNSTYPRYVIDDSVRFSDCLSFICMHISYIHICNMEKCFFTHTTIYI